MSDERNYEEEKSREKEEVEELREIFNAIQEFLDKAKDVVKEILSYLTESLNGEKLGKEVASLYKELKASGLPDEVVNEMVKDFYKKKLEAVPSINDILKSLTQSLASKKVVIGKVFEKEEEGKEEEEE